MGTVLCCMEINAGDSRSKQAETSGKSHDLETHLIANEISFVACIVSQTF